MENLIIKNNSGSENIGSNVLLKIYELALLTSGTLLLSGNIIVPHAKQSVLDYFENNFHDLHITLTGLKYIEFADPVVAWHIAKSYDPDGIGITLSDLNSINWITTSMEGNTQITSFNELSLFININTIKQEAFKGCTSLSSIDLSNITTIELDAFLNCTSLTSIDLSNVTSIGETAFKGCSLLSAVTFSSSLTSIGSGAFQGTSCSFYDLSNTQITTGAQNMCFGNGSDVNTTVIFPTTFTKISVNFCDRCNKITNLTFVFKASVVVTVSSQSYTSDIYKDYVFFGGIPSGLKIYVPDALVNDYITEWGSNFLSHIFPMSLYNAS